MSKFGMNVNDEDIKKIMEEHDANNDGNISKDEFANMFEEALGM